MCLSTPKPPAPPPPPQIQKPAEIEESGGLKMASQRRNQMLIKKQKSVTGAAPTSNMA